MLILADITEVHEMIQALRYQTTLDSLTDPFNRYEFEAQLKHALELAHSSVITSLFCYQRQAKVCI